MVISPGLGARLREERERKGLNQADFAKLSGVSRNSQAAYENETTSPNTEYLAALDEANIDVMFVLSGMRGTRDSLTTQEFETLDMLRGFSDQQRAALLTIMRSMLGSGA